MHYYQFNIGDYASHTAHLEPLEDLAYRRLIDWCYLNEMKLPLDLDEIGRLIRMRSHIESIEIVLQDFFVRDDDGYSQPRIDGELNAYKEKSEKARKSAKARWNKEASKNGDLGDANALRTQCDGNAKHKPLTKNHKPLTKNHKPLTKNHKPLTNKTLVESGDSPEILFEEFWSAYPQKKSKAPAKKIWLKLNPTRQLTNQMLANISERLSLGDWSLADRQFIPHPTTYLKQARWEDQVYSRATLPADQEKAQRDEEIEAWINGEEKDLAGNVVTPAANSNVIEGSFING